MISLEPLFCPCCTGAMLHTLSQHGMLLSQSFLELGRGALITRLGQSEPIGNPPRRYPVSVSTSSSTESVP